MTAILDREPLAETPEAGTADHDLPAEEGLRPARPDDFLAAAAWGIVTALVCGAVSVAVLPVPYLALVFLLGAGLGFLGYLDHATRLIRNKHSLAFGSAAAILITATQALTGEALLVPAVAAAAAAFVFMLALALTAGFVGGGDIKLAPVPAALLAAISPVAALLWLQFTFLGCLAGMIACRLAGKRDKHQAMAPYMAVAAVLALGCYGLLRPALGI